MNMRQDKMPLHQKIGKEVMLKPTYCVVVNRNNQDVMSGKPSFVTFKPIWCDKEHRKEMQIHIRLVATEKEDHTPLPQPVTLDVDCYVEKEQFEKKLQEFLPNKQMQF